MSQEQPIDQFMPYLDHYGRPSECLASYQLRMKIFLPNWPDELLAQWLYRHWCCAGKYSFLGFETLSFLKEEWALMSIPNRSVFDEPEFCDNFINVSDRAQDPHDWLAKYMLQHGTWNTPVILLDNRECGVTFPDGTSLRAPYHLLEGHRRLAFLNGLRIMNKARDTHKVWVATRATV